jgi:hypothetical protein
MALIERARIPARVGAKNKKRPRREPRPPIACVSNQKEPWNCITKRLRSWIAAVAGLTLGSIFS